MPKQPSYYRRNGTIPCAVCGDETIMASGMCDDCYDLEAYFQRLSRERKIQWLQDKLKKIGYADFATLASRLLDP